MSNNPTMPINVNSSIVIIDIAELGTSYSKSYFYLWYKNERSASIPWNASSLFVQKVLENMSAIFGSVCVARSSSSFNSIGYRWAIRLDDRHDDFNYGFSVQTANVYLDHEASNVSILELKTNEPLDDWVAEDGEREMCTERHAYFANGSGTDTLTFLYEVLPGDTVSKLNFTSLESVIKVGQEARICNAINHGMVSHVDVKLKAVKSFGKDILIDTSTPHIQNVSFIGGASLTKKYHVGDSLYFSMKFNKNVVVSHSQF